MLILIIRFFLVEGEDEDAHKAPAAPRRAVGKVAADVRRRT